MKSVKFITTFLLLFVLSIFISYANIEGNNWTDNFIETFKQTNAKFKYYDIKINSTVSNEKTENKDVPAEKPQKKPENSNDIIIKD